MAADRRREPRCSAEQTPWPHVALLRPGQEVVLLDVSGHGARIESPRRLTPGARAELHLLGIPRLVLLGHVHRCRITRLSPLRYEGAILFDVVRSEVLVATRAVAMARLGRGG